MRIDEDNIFTLKILPALEDFIKKNEEGDIYSPRLKPGAIEVIFLNIGNLST